MTALASLLKERPEPIEHMTISIRVIPYTLFLPILSPSQPKKSWPERVPQNATPLTAAATFGGKLPGFSAPSMW
ncbi:hypothetical protein OIU76_001485 [Salix suchowensis]|nr:hypothetical protein OIU76_001485 [Salix suchowensis]